MYVYIYLILRGNGVFIKCPKLWQENRTNQNFANSKQLIFFIYIYINS